MTSILIKTDKSVYTEKASDILSSQLRLRDIKAYRSGQHDLTIVLRLNPEMENDENTLHSSAFSAEISAGSLSGFLSACGRLLRGMDFSCGNICFTEADNYEKPVLPMRYNLIPGHFGNSYESMKRLQMKQFLVDQALSGANGYADRFDLTEGVSPFRHHGNGHNPPLTFCSALWSKKARHLIDAGELGMKTGITCNPNHVYADQWSEQLAARAGKNMIGNLICPSTKEGRRIIMENWSDLFDYLADTGINLDFVRPAPYDDGGCACEKCRPWLATFLKLSKDIISKARKRHTDIAVYMSGWWLDDNDLDMIVKSSSGGAQFPDALLYSTAYHNSMPELANRIAPLKLAAFIHAGYSAGPQDKYNTNGTHSAPKRLQNLVKLLHTRGARGFLTYTEGVESHLNMFLCARLACNPDCDVTDEMTGYFRWYFGCDTTTAKKLSAICLAMETLDSSKAGEWLKKLNTLSGKCSMLKNHEYLMTQLVIKARLMALDHSAQQLTKTPPSKTKNGRLPTPAASQKKLRELALKYEELYEELCGFVWNISVPRYIIQDQARVPQWLSTYWQKHFPDRNMIKRKENPHNPNPEIKDD